MRTRCFYLITFLLAMPAYLAAHPEASEDLVDNGNTQKLVSMAFDCDGDAVICLVQQVGNACHTGRRDCFYLQVDIENQRVIIKGEADLL